MWTYHFPWVSSLVLFIHHLHILTTNKEHSLSLLSPKTHTPVQLVNVSSLGIYTHFWLDKNFDWQLSNPVFPKDRSADHLWSAKILELVLGKLFWTHNMLKNDSKHHFLVKYWSAEWLCGPRGKKFWILWSAIWKSLGNTGLI